MAGLYSKVLRRDKSGFEIGKLRRELVVIIYILRNEKKEKE